MAVTWLLEYRCDAYRFGRSGSVGPLISVPVGSATDVDDLAARMTEEGYAGQRVMLAIPSEWCLSASVVLASRRMTRNRQAVAFAVEEKLPFSAEEMVTDYMARQTDVFGVAVESSVLQESVESLENAGIAVATIVPSALLMLQWLDQARRLPRCGLLVLGNSDSCDIFQLSHSRPAQWSWCPCDGESVKREVAVVLLSRGDEEQTALVVNATNLCDTVVQALHELEPEVAVSTQSLDQERVLLAEAANVLARGRRPWIELRRDQVGEYDPYSLVRGSIHFFLVAIVLALASVVAAGWIRGNQYAAVTESIECQKRELFRQLFPGARIPAGVRSRLESERRKLMGMSGAHDQLDSIEPITGFLVDVLAHLPREMRFRLLEMEFDEDAGYLEGEARRHGDVDLLAAALRQRGYTVEPPHTEQLAGEGVAFALSIAPIAKSEQ